MFFGQQRTVVVAGAVLIGLLSGELCAQQYAQQAAPATVTVEMGPNGPVIMKDGVPQPMPPGAVRMMPGGGPPGAPGGPPPGIVPAPGGPPKPDGEKPEGEKKPDSDKGEKKDEKKEGDDKGKGATKRPTEPSEPPDPEVLKIRPDADGKVSFNFKGHSWPSVMEWIAGVSGMSLDWQELPEGYLNLITQKKFDVAEARDLINRHLLARGYTMLIQDEVISVFKIDSINPGMVPRLEPEQLADQQPYQFVKVSFSLDWLLASDAAEELKPMISPNGKLAALEATNRLEAMDAVVNLQQVYEVLKQEQSDSGQERLVREFPLKHTSAKDVVQYLNTLLGIEPKGAPKMPMDPQQMEAMKRQAQMEAEMAKNAGKGGPAPKPKAEVYLLANERKNSVVVNAPPDKMAVIAQAVEILDVSTIPDESIIENIGRIHVYRLDNADPAAVVKMIQQMGSLDHTSHLEVDKENNAIIASATLVDHVTIRTLVDRLDRGGRQSVILPLDDLRAEMVVKQIDFLMGGAEETDADSRGTSSNREFNPFDPFGRSFSRPRSSQPSGHEDKFRVSADVKNNALILWCNEFELRKVEDLLGQLRAIPESDSGTFEVRVYRLNTLDPEPLVSTLEDMDALGVHASLKADKESKSIVAYATGSDHEKIQQLIDRLDSSGRKFEVVQLRRLQADYVAGTIEFMMDAGEKEQQSSSRYYWDYYSRGRGDEGKDKSGFKIDADVESNRLLLLANETEMKEVMNLLVKLGEIPADGADESKVRIIDTLPGPELEELLQQIQKAWPSMAPNPLLLPEKPDEGEEKTGEPDKSKLPRPSTATASPNGPTVRFAQHETTGESPSPEAPAAEAASAAAGELSTANGSVSASGEPPAVKEPAAGGSNGGNGAGTATGVSVTGKAPVSISVRPDGRLLISSDDTQALDRLEELLANLAPERPDYHLFRLKYAYASSVAYNLEDVFKEKKEEPSGRGRTYYFYDYYGGSGNKEKEQKFRLSKRRPLKFISDFDSNSILVQNADPEQLKLISDLIEFYDQPAPPDSQSVRKTEVVKVKFSKASVIAETVKEVYRDLLSANDKALASGQQRQMPERNFTYVFDYDSGGSGDSEERKTPSFKGLLSLGVDDLSNTLIVSAPAFFITDVLKVIENLDQAAEPTTETVEVVSLGEGVSAPELQKTLMKILQQRSAGKTGENAKPQQPRQPGQGPGPGGPGPR